MADDVQALTAADRPAWSERAWGRAMRRRRGRPFAALVLALLVVLLAEPGLDAARPLRFWVFDGYQALWPRVRASDRAVIVAVDDGSLERVGQWPWPRTVLARLIDRIAAGDPAAIGIDIVMSEPDRLSPGRLLDDVRAVDPDLAERLARLPGHDDVLATALRGAPVVLGVAGLREPAGGAPGRRPPVRLVGGDSLPAVSRFESALRSIETLDAAAAGHGLLNDESAMAVPEAHTAPPAPRSAADGVVRRVPLVATVAGQVMPGLAVEMLRVATGRPTWTVHVDPGGVRAVEIGELRIPTQPDGTVWIHYSRHDEDRFVTAADVLDGAIDAGWFQGRLVLVGVNATGLSDTRVTPVAARMAGVEIHAQVLEGIIEGRLLARPAWLGWAEATLLGLGGLLMILLVPIRRVTWSAAALLMLSAGVAGLFLYLQFRLLFDPVTPALGLGLVFTSMLAVTLSEIDSHRRALRRELQAQREAAARVAGELEAARRIQLGLLPDPAAVFAGERRFDLYAFLEPARVVGGDLYDFFLVDEHRLFFVVGDVSGKGLPASLFMAASKAVVRSTVLRHPDDVAAALTAINAELARNNPEALFVTAVAGLLDVTTGELTCASAGHDAPYLRPAGGGPPRQLALDGGLPLGAVDEFAYAAAAARLAPGDALCLTTDGVVDTVAPGGAFYGRERLEAVLASLPPATDPRAVGDAIRGDVARFQAGAEQADDLAILVVRWNGPPPSPA